MWSVCLGASLSNVFAVEGQAPTLWLPVLVVGLFDTVVTLFAVRGAWLAHLAAAEGTT